MSESLKDSLCSMLIKVYLLCNQLCVFDFLQPVVKPTANQMSATRAISDARANSHLQNKGWSRCEEHMWIIALDALSHSMGNFNCMSPGWFLKSLYVSSFFLGMKLLMMMPRIHLLYPLTLVRGFWEDMMSQAHSFITSSWTFYLQADDGKVVIFQVMWW